MSRTLELEQSSTDDRRQSYHAQHLCVQHYGRDATRRAGPSASAETCRSSAELL